MSVIFGPDVKGGEKNPKTKNRKTSFFILYKAFIIYAQTSKKKFVIVY